MPVAIVGIGCRFPGNVNDVASFWTLLTEGRDAISEIPADRFSLDHYYDARPATPGRVMSRWGGFLDRLDEFDAEFFGLSRAHAERLDPQQRLLLETTWEALEDAGEDIAALSGSKTGVFVGQWLSDFENRLFANAEIVDFPMTLGSGRYAASGRISYSLGLRGPSLCVDAACASGLAAIHLAVRSLRAGDSTIALAGGANVILQPHIHIAYSQSRMMAPDGRCKFGDASGDGYVRAEGAGIVVLKPLSSALAAGDRVYAVIRGSALNSDGASSGSMGRPSGVGQEELLYSALSDAGMLPERVGYVEAHGTGTRVGDPVELGALAAVLGTGRTGDNRAWVGSVKSNFGHTEAAAGVAGLIKSALMLYHRQIAPSLHFRHPNPGVPWDTLPLVIPTAVTPWVRGDYARVAGVSAFGIVGTNAHIVLEDFEQPGAQAEFSPSAAGVPASDLAVILPVSARSAEGLRALAQRYAAWLESDSSPSSASACWNVGTRRAALPHRAVFVATDKAMLAQRLHEFAVDGPADAQGTVYEVERPRIAYVVPGQGGQWSGMARNLFAQQSEFRAAFEECDRAARAYASFSLIEQLHADETSAAFLGNRIDVVQPMLVALAISYARWLATVGITPSAIVGHSLGEIGAAAIAGVLTIEQAMQIICLRSALMRRVSGQGAMAMVELSADAVEARIAAQDSELSLAVTNSPQSSVVSGAPDAVAALLKELEHDGVFARRVNVDVASHSSQMTSLASELAAALAGLVPGAETVPIYSTVDGRKRDGCDFTAAYWARNLRERVRFDQATQALLADGITVFLELGPHGVLVQAVLQIARAADAQIAESVVAVACGKRDESDTVSLAKTLGALWCAGVGPDWKRVLAPSPTLDNVPLYPWQRERYWVDSAETPVPGAAAAGAGAATRPSDETLQWLHRLQWVAQPSAQSTGVTPHQNWLLVGGLAASKAAAAAETVGIRTTVVRSTDELTTNLSQHGNDDAASWTAVVAFADEDQTTAYLPVQLLQRLLPMRRAAHARLWFITNCAQRVLSAEDNALSVEQAAFWGSARVVGEEHPDRWGGLVDLSFGNVDALDDVMPFLVREVAEANPEDVSAEDQIAIRNGQRYVLRLAPVAESLRRTPFVWRRDATYVITGGLGDIGLRVAKELVELGARRLVLMSRSSLPPRNQWGDFDAQSVQGMRVNAIRALEVMGASIHAVSVDVGDEASLRAFLDQYRSEGWPAIRGVVHAAGVMNNHLATDLDAKSFDAVVAPKLRGAQLLDRLLPDLDLFVLFSSTGAFLVQAGQANYAAANAGLDALALNRRALGKPALSIGWGVWEGSGMVAGGSGARNVIEMARQGIGSFNANDGITLFSWLLSSASGYVTVLPVDWARFASARRGRRQALYQQVAGIHTSAAPTEHPAEQLGNATPAERRALLDRTVRATLGTLLKLAPHRIETRQTFGSIGLDSLMAMEFRNRLEQQLGRALPATLAWNYPTLSSVVAFLCGDAEPLKNARPSDVNAVSDMTLGISQSDVAELSDAEAALALRRRGKRTGR